MVSTPTFLTPWSYLRTYGATYLSTVGHGRTYVPHAEWSVATELELGRDSVSWRFVASECTPPTPAGARLVAHLGGWPEALPQLRAHTCRPERSSLASGRSAHRSRHQGEAPMGRPCAEAHRAIARAVVAKS